MGHVNVDDMLRQITTDQFEEWYAFWTLEPWDVRTAAAVISKTVADSMTHNIASRSGVEWKTEFASRIADFLPGWKPKKRKPVGKIFGIPLRVKRNGND